MIEAEPFHLALQQFFLKGASPFTVSLLQTKISQSCESFDLQFMVRSKTAAGIPDRTLQQRVRKSQLPPMPIGNAYHDHQTERLRMIRSEPALVGT
jgi:hypothetical protein